MSVRLMIAASEGFVEDDGRRDVFSMISVAVPPWSLLIFGYNWSDNLALAKPGILYLTLETMHIQNQLVECLPSITTLNNAFAISLLVSTKLSILFSSNSKRR